MRQFCLVHRVILGSIYKWQNCVSDLLRIVSVNICMLNCFFNTSLIMLQVSFSFNYFNELFNCARETSKMSSTITLYYVMDWVSNHFIMHCLSTSLCITWNEWTGEQYLPSDMERCLTRYSSVYTPVIMYVLYDPPCAEKDVKPRYTIQHNAMQRDATWHDGTQHNAAHATQYNATEQVVTTINIYLKSVYNNTEAARLFNIHPRWTWICKIRMYCRSSILSVLYYGNGEMSL